MKRNIKISGISDATTLVTKASAVEGDVTITRGRYSIDAKSIMGVFSIDLSAGVIIEYPDGEIELDKYCKKFEI